MAIVYIFLYIVASIIAQYCNKRLVNLYPSGAVVSGMYWICFVGAACIAVIYGPINILPLVVLVAAVNVLAVWLFAGSLRINMAQTFLVIPLSNSIAVALGAAYLSEWRLLDPRTVQGGIQLVSAGLLIGASVLFALKENNSSRINWRWIMPLAGFIILNGGISFFIKEFALAETSTSSYLVSWYTGTCAAAVIPCVFTPATRRFVVHKNWFLFFVMALTTIGAMWSNFKVLSFTPGAVVFPLTAAFYTAGTVLVGLFIFKERQNLTRLNWVGVGCGVAGVALAFVVRVV